ncbi:helix-turn-helix transcriptional regulator [Mycobacteroides chelonae]|uniref:isoniazid response ATPase/transcriptional regulator IniR n=1 Tax=Mycobacteroides chelonae TaxID=1774 RepID=UPI0008A86F93|nr:isoniazid response ATPase/transcriptional regulator IniR [Mycobacteroides chelonae]MBF9523509.1 helix-turn-helix transcriptional regulator [Mycobacteroides chelonae]OHU15259.1 helix-turn-helix transcriptional regulator [Mycobacteroides chelonae]OHU59205.1 helix-turn-helix transcriptional regulator [Mycobacteroides chelonae]PKQ59220.1 helix-turn-helix transcriptional regulator [Mycobacterium sp. MHSD3]
MSAGGAAKVLISGTAGSGKTSILARVRDVLSTTGSAPVNHVPETTTGKGLGPFVIDDADSLSGPQLDTLRAVVENDPTAIVVVAATPRRQPALRALFQALERESPTIALGPVDKGDIARLSARSAAFADEIATATGGVLALVAAAVDRLDGADSLESALRAIDSRIDEQLRRLSPSAQAAVLLMSLDPGIGASDIAAALALSDAEDLVDEALGSGLVPSPGQIAFAARVHGCATRLLGAARHLDLERSLLRTQLDIGSVSTDLALALVAHGLRDTQIAGLLAEWAATESDPLTAADLYRAALTAGAEPGPIRVPLAESLARAGDLTAAATQADEVLNATDPGHRAAAVRIAAAIACHNGDSGQAVALYDWLGTGLNGLTALSAAPVFVGIGQLTSARKVLEDNVGAPPTTSATATRNAAQGVIASVEGRGHEALSLLGQAVTQQPSSSSFTPDSTVALAALTMLHSGETARARGVLAGAIRTDLPHDVFAVRHRLLAAWIAMLSGDLTGAAQWLPEADAELSRRDRLFAESLRTGIARRHGDTGPLRQHWQAAMDALSAYSIDLYTLLPVGELWVAAARLRTLDAVTHHVDRAFAILAQLGDPIAWSAPLRWAGVHAAILTNSPENLAPHGQALAAAAGVSPYARTLATAGRTWLRVLANQVDGAEVDGAARMLADTGLGWDATRLASQAALHANDPKVAAAMLALARDLRTPSANTDGPDPAAAPSSAADSPTSTRLSDREREVAELLLRGLPYRDIGAQLFISAKTVEHHVARIRRRLGAESRSDMFSMLRSILTP